MNFYFSTKKVDLSFYNLKKHIINNKYYLYLDNDWVEEKNYFYKGTNLSWCKIFKVPEIKFETNNLRDFPIYYNKDTISNFFRLEKVLPVDGCIAVNNTIHITFKKDFYNILMGKELNFNQCKELISSCLLGDVKNFLNLNSKPIFLPKQNGVDTLTVRSILDHLKVKYELFDLPKIKPNRSNLGEFLAKNFWAFNQIQELMDSVIVTGFYGDEWILRNPYYVSILLAQRGIDIIEEFSQLPDSYMKNYFSTYQKKCVRQTALTKLDLMSRICNDYQIWHLHNTYFFSPLKNIKFLNLLNADDNTVLKQITNAELSKSVIENFNPALLKLLDQEKNMYDPNYFIEKSVEI